MAATTIAAPNPKTRQKLAAAPFAATLHGQVGKQSGNLIFSPARRVGEHGGARTLDLPYRARSSKDRRDPARQFNSLLGAVAVPRVVPAGSSNGGQPRCP